MSAATMARCRLAVLVGRRWQSTHAEEFPSFKAALHAVYKKVHPDLFHNHQAAKAANTRSMKLLHEYVEATQTGPKVALPYRFHFFVHGNGGASAPTTPAAAPAPASPVPGSLPPGLREVVVTLPPPTRGVPGEALSAGSRKGFTSLLAALGLPSRFAGGADGNTATEHYSRFVSLRDFLPQAVETVHRHAAVQSSADLPLSALRTALRLAHNVSVGFGFASSQLPLLQQLVAALDSLPAGTDLSGLELMLGQHSGVDLLGRVWLAEAGSQEDWARHLASVDTAYCRRRQDLMRELRARERAVAAALGLDLLFTEQQETLLNPEHGRLMERLAEAAAERGPIGGGSFKELSIMLTSAVGDTAAEHSHGGESHSSSSSSDSSEEVGGITASGSPGLMLAPLSVSADQLYTAVQQVGVPLVAEKQRLRLQSEQLHTLRTQVQQKLSLRMLLRDPAVQESEYRSCLNRMLGNAQQLSGLLHGTCVRVAEVNAVWPDRGGIDIAWNWRM